MLILIGGGGRFGFGFGLGDGKDGLVRGDFLGDDVGSGFCVFRL